MEKREERDKSETETERVRAEREKALGEEGNEHESVKRPQSEC